MVDAPKLSDSQNLRDPDIDVEILLTYNMLYGKFLLSLYVEVVSYPRFLLTPVNSEDRQPLFCFYVRVPLIPRFSDW